MRERVLADEKVRAATDGKAGCQGNCCCGQAGQRGGPIMASDKGPMSKPPNPITQGLRAVTRDPAHFHGRNSLALVVCSSGLPAGCRRRAMLLGPLHVGPVWDNCVAQPRSSKNESGGIGDCFDSGSQGHHYRDDRCPAAIALLWGILSALGRFVTVKRLRAGLTSLRFRSIIALQFLRGICWLVFFRSFVRRNFWRSAHRHPAAPSRTCFFIT